ncbi:MATH domain and coiled-coil domain-containing protein At3g58410-like isoform X2 [Carya illinoinensis]|uniref:MATH domain and coiled-coil domain-containing protein At3g58410-like isoform X2 n=1 Tax=Carya illinoinensis TaxID=32201 RepID=UPI001C724EC9|nr:MATH domain and coiled-coil domain-containing protein At3g58410-like isoform X2 [Carya illinoinensis]
MAGPPPTNPAPEVTRFTRDLPPAHYILKIESLSKIIQMLPGEKKPKYDSEVFECGGYKWKLSLYPIGRKECDNAENISLYLAIEDTDSLPLCWEVNAMFKLFVLDQIRGEYLAVQDSKWFSTSKRGYDHPKFLSLSMLKDPSRSLLANDLLVVEAHIEIISMVKINFTNGKKKNKNYIVGYSFKS